MFKVGDKVRVNYEGSKPATIATVNHIKKTYSIQYEDGNVGYDWWKDTELVANGTPLTNENNKPASADENCKVPNCNVCAALAAQDKENANKAPIITVNINIKCTCIDLLKGHMPECLYLLSRNKV